MKEDVFRFKKFDVSHSESSMKVGVDAVLLGAWAGINAHNILEVGTGCGVISLMLAQRFPDATITAIDIDVASIEEARKNFANSPWSSNIKGVIEEFPIVNSSLHFKYDLIVSNPPFFLSGVICPSTPREKARHQDSLSVFSLLRYSSQLMKDDGRLDMIFPSDYYEKVIKVAEENDFICVRECWIKNKEAKETKRIMAEFKKRRSEKDESIEKSQLILFEDGVPTSDYIDLCKDFYIKF